MSFKELAARLDAAPSEYCPVTMPPVLRVVSESESPFCGVSLTV
jgi:hypothetical protein